MKIDAGKLRRLLQDNELNIKIVSERSGLHYRTVQETIHRASCNPATAIRIARAIGIPLREFIPCGKTKMSISEIIGVLHDSRLESVYYSKDELAVVLSETIDRLLEINAHAPAVPECAEANGEGRKVNAGWN